MSDRRGITTQKPKFKQEYYQISFS